MAMCRAVDAEVRVLDASDGGGTSTSSRRCVCETGSGCAKAEPVAAMPPTVAAGGLVKLRALSWRPASREADGDGRFLEDGCSSSQAISLSLARCAELVPQQCGRTALVSALECDARGERIATAGVQKIVRVFDVRALANGNEEEEEEEEEASAPRGGGSIYDDGEEATTSLCAQFFNPAKVSALAWGGRDAVLGCADYDGIFSRHDLETGALLSEGDDHGGRRVWSLRHKAEDGTYVTAGEDGRVCLWEGSSMSSRAAMRIVPQQTGVQRPSVCCADFLRRDVPLVAMALSDSSIQVADLRYRGCAGGWYAHCGAVSSLRIVDDAMISSSVDSSAALWDLSGACGVLQPELVRRYSAHSNTRNFVGLSMRRDGFVACGSESCEFLVYHRNWDEPVARKAICTELGGHATSGVASALCWHPDERTELLFAGCSSGGVCAFRSRQRVMSAASMTTGAGILPLHRDL